MISKHIYTVQICLFLFITPVCFGFFGGPDGDTCFCQLKGSLNDCSCNVNTVDYFNNVKIYPRLRSLLSKDYFRFYKVNLKRECPYWTDDSRCAIRYCHVEACAQDSIPPGLKGSPKNTVVESGNVGVKMYLKTSNCESDHNEELSYLNTTISAKTKEEFALWKAYDDALENFCIIDDSPNHSEYVDLLLNPERYTGYKGKSAHRIWDSIYKENCFRPRAKLTSYIPSNILNGMCLEKRVFYRAVSGLHTSINIHLCAKYLLSEPNGLDIRSRESQWGLNLKEFVRRFSPEMTNNEGPNWLRNLYFLYLLELRALVKASPFLLREEYYTGNEQEDLGTKLAIEDLLNVAKIYPEHFNERSMFVGGEKAKKLKYEFKQHFRNISSIMDCVGCDKCKLWGKLQVQGLGTALKILFSDYFDDTNLNQYVALKHKNHLQLKRTEIVSLINSIGRLSTSIYELEGFREMLRSSL